MYGYKDLFPAHITLVRITSPCHTGLHKAFCWANWYRGRYFTGLVDELRVYNDTLTPTQIQTLSFVKPLDAEEAASFKLNYYAHFNDIAINDTLDLVRVLEPRGSVASQVFAFRSKAGSQVQDFGSVKFSNEKFMELKMFRFTVLDFCHVSHSIGYPASCIR